MLTRFLTLLFSIGLLPASAFAINNFTEVAISPNSSGGTGPADVIHQGLGPQDTSASATGGSGITASSGSGTSHVDYGHMALAGSSNINLTTLSRGYMQDMVTITSPSIPNGTLGTLSYSVTIYGSLAPSAGQSAASYQLQSSIGGTFDINRSATQFGPDSNPHFAGDPLGTYTGHETFQFGSAFLLTVQSTASAQTTVDFANPSASSFDLHLVWGGIFNITSNGVPVANATSSSNSGTNWLAPSSLPGDANLDGHVDLTDLSIVLNNFGSTTPNWTSGNFDHAATIDLTDLSDVLNNFGDSNPSLSNAAPTLAAPEPTTLCTLCTFALPALLLIHTRRSQRRALLRMRHES